MTKLVINSSEIKQPPCTPKKLENENDYRIETNGRTDITVGGKKEKTSKKVEL